MSGNPTRLALFIGDLKRRGVTRLASIYAVAGLGVIEAFDIIGGRFMLPDWSFKAVIILTIAGFPIALILAWIYDLNSGGIVKTDPLTPSQKASIKLSWKPGWFSIILLLILLITSTAFFTFPRPNALGFKQQDWILIADLENNTGDEVFDKTLLNALTVTIDQSKRINIYPRTQVDEVLRRMKLDTIETINTPVAMEIAERENIKAVLLLSISELGGSYILTTKLINPFTGETIRSNQETAQGKEEILSALNKLAIAVRKGLGDSLQEIHMRTVPLEKATTHSLEALKYLTDAQNTYGDSYLSRRIEILHNAIDLDPEFALAHSFLGTYYYWSNDRENGEKHFIISLSLLDRLTEYERLWIEADVEGNRGNREASVRKWRTFLDKYPNNYLAWFNLGYNYMMLNNQDESIKAFSRCLEIYNDDDPGVFINIATNYAKLGKYEEAINYYQEAFGLFPDYKHYPSLVHEYGFTYAKMGDLQKAKEVLDKSLDGDEGQLAHHKRSVALLLMYQGKYAEALNMMHDAVILHKSLGYKLSELRNRLYLCKIYQSRGMTEEYQAELDHCSAIVGESATEPTWFLRVGLLLARNGELEKAEEMLNEISQRSNKGNKTDEAAYNLLKGEIELARGNPAASLESIETAVAIDGTVFNLESLANYYMEAENWEQAIVTLEKMMGSKDALGWEAQQCWIDAHFKLIKAYHRTGDLERAQAVFNKIQAIWSEAEEDLPQLLETKSMLEG